jgi:hypothetical protein
MAAMAAMASALETPAPGLWLSTATSEHQRLTPDLAVFRSYWMGHDRSLGNSGETSRVCKITINGLVKGKIYRKNPYYPIFNGKNHGFL